MKGKKRKIALLLVFIAAVIYILEFSPLNYYFFHEEGRALFMERFSGYMERIGGWAPFVFILFFIFCIAFFVPASIPVSIGSLVFGSWTGLLLNLIGANIGGIMAFFLSRYLLRGFAAKLLRHAHFKKLDDKVEEHGFSIIIYLRLMFLPFTYLSFASGLSKIRFKDFFWATFIGVIPGIIFVTFFVGAVKKLLIRYKSFGDIIREPSGFLTPDVIIPFVLFAFSFAIPSIIRHYKKKFYVTKAIEKEAGVEE
ncbi:MAG TPA: TVP38/TMEM64 family protein [bacterium]|nr:TVP38/TMEM64 family protein [bacterium]